MSAIPRGMHWWSSNRFISSGADLCRSKLHLWGGLCVTWVAILPGLALQSPGFSWLECGFKAPKSCAIWEWGCACKAGRKYVSLEMSIKEISITRDTIKGNNYQLRYQKGDNCQSSMVMSISRGINFAIVLIWRGGLCGPQSLPEMSLKPSL